MNKWEDAYPELVNKIRWAISTTFATTQSRYPFQASQALATVFAQEILDLVKEGERTPGLLSATGTIRSYRQQLPILAELDKADVGV